MFRGASKGHCAVKIVVPRTECCENGPLAGPRLVCSRDYVPAQYSLQLNTAAVSDHQPGSTPAVTHIQTVEEQTTAVAILNSCPCACDTSVARPGAAWDQLASRRSRTRTLRPRPRGAAKRSAALLQPAASMPRPLPLHLAASLLREARALGEGKLSLRTAPSGGWGSFNEDAASGMRECRAPSSRVVVWGECRPHP